MHAEIMTVTSLLREEVGGILLVAFVAMWLWVYSTTRPTAFEAGSPEA